MAEQNMAGYVTKEMTIGDVVGKFPQASEIMLSHGLHCIGCHVNPYESIEMGAKGHGLSDEVVQTIISEINEAISMAAGGLTAGAQAAEHHHEHDHSHSLELTEKAANKLSELMASRGKADHGVRIRVIKGGCSGNMYDMAFEATPDVNDKVLNIHGVKVFVDHNSMELLGGMSVDYVETIQASGFKFNNPNAHSTCGCGKSFG